jgi:hypothetical protein
MRIRPSVLFLVAASLALSLASAASATSAATSSTSAKGSSTVRHVAYRDWTSAAGFAKGRFTGTGVDAGRLALTEPTGTMSYTDPYGDAGSRRYEYGRWTSPVVRPGFDYTELVASWNARTPGGSWLQVEVRGTADTGGTSKWYVLGRWAAGDRGIHRTSVPGQGDDLAYVTVDTLVAAKGRSLSTWQLRVTLYRPVGSTVTPRVSLVGAMASALPDDKKVPVSPVNGAAGITLDVPTYSQEIHVGEYPQWDNGGEAWCSPTATAMVLAYWDSGPTPDDYSWVDPSFADPWVDHAARYVYDYAYDGAGNWPFNTAYAATFGLESFVTRLRSLTEAEQFIKAGIPLVASVSFKKSELDGAGYGTNGHLLVIVGFTKRGDVVVNDPASHLVASNAQVRTVYDREQFENVWIPHSGGIVYVIHPASAPLPPSPAEANW